jgi:Electron transfer DM13
MGFDVAWVDRTCVTAGVYGRVGRRRTSTFGHRNVTHSPHHPAMTFLGDLERAFATVLYPLRVPIAIGLAVALVALVIIARRRGWFRAARRHPARAVSLAAALLVVGLPVAWYLGSPLFIRTSLTEPPPAASPSAPAVATPDRPTPTAPDTTSAPAATSGPATTGGPERRGMFVGADEFHFGSGTARLVETASGSWTVRFEGFSVRNGPDLYVYLSPDPAGYADGAVELGTLKATDGDFNTDVPAGTDVTAVRSVVIWCKQFAVLFAVAELS